MKKIVVYVLILSMYLAEGLNGFVSEEYQNPYGQGRINIIGG